MDCKVTLTQNKYKKCMQAKKKIDLLIDEHNKLIDEHNKTRKQYNKKIKI